MKVKLDDGSSWPALGASLDAVEWELRYGDGQSVLETAAGIVAAYRALILANTARRNEVVRVIRDKLKEIEA